MSPGEARAQGFTHVCKFAGVRHWLRILPDGMQHLVSMSRLTGWWAEFWLNVHCLLNRKLGLSEPFVIRDIQPIEFYAEAKA